MEKEYFYRKIIVALLTSLFLSLIISIIENKAALSSIISGIPTYILFSLPIVLIYGIITSTISDALASKLSKNIDKKIKYFYSAVFHVLFGLILSWYSIMGAVIFFLLDMILIMIKSQYKLKDMIITFFILAIIFLLLMTSINFIY